MVCVHTVCPIYITLFNDLVEYYFINSLLEKDKCTVLNLKIVQFSVLKTTHKTTTPSNIQCPILSYQKETQENESSIESLDEGLGDANDDELMYITLC